MGADRARVRLHRYRGGGPGRVFGSTACWSAKRSRAMSSTWRRSQHRADAGGQRPTRSMAKRWFVRCYPLSRCLPLRSKPRQGVKSARAALRPRGELKGRCIASKRFRHRAQTRGGARICGFTVASPCAGIAGALIAAPSTPPERLVCGKSRRQGRNIRHRPSAGAPAL